MALLRLMPKVVCVSILCAFFGAANVYAAVGGTINDDGVNIRSKGSLDSDVVSKASSGQAVTVYLAEGDFYLVSINGKENVYVSKQFVSINQAYGVVSAANVNVRRSPELTGQVAGKVNEGHFLGVSSRTGDWYAITYYGAPAYVHKDFMAGSALANVKATEPPKTEPQKQEAPVVLPPDTSQQGVLPNSAKEPPVIEAPLNTASIKEAPLNEAPVVTEPQKEPLLQEPLLQEPLLMEEPGNVPPQDLSWQEQLPLELANPSPDRIAEYSVEPQVIELSNTPNDAPVSAYDPIYAFCTADPGLNLRSAPSTDSDILIVIDYGEVFDVLEIGDPWLKVNFYGQIGFVNADYIDISYGVKPEKKLKPRQEISRGDEIVAYAKQFLGTPYVYGGSSLKSGVDCSGFVYSVMKNFGIKLNRSSSSMTADGRSISANELRSGDLVFFAANGTNVSHVAIYVGNGQYIHSTDSGGRGVSFGNLNDSYASRTYHSSRRVIE